MFKRIFAIVFMVFALGACTKVPAGSVGVKFNLYGGEKGVSGEVVGPGKYWLGWNEELYLFPTFTQNYTWTKEKTEQSPSDESVSFQDGEGIAINADIGISYAIQADKANTVFQKYRKGAEEITDTYLRNMVRDALSRNSASMTAAEIYGAKRSELMDAVQRDVRAQVAGLGINVEKIYWIGSIRLPENIVQAINLKVASTQKAQQRENELQTAKAQAQIAREQARGTSDALLIEAEAQSKANKLLSDSITPTLVNYKSVEKWDGKLPHVAGQATPFVDLRSVK